MVEVSQFVIGRERNDRLRVAARKNNQSASELVRDAIDAYLVELEGETRKEQKEEESDG
jgi:predicted DNA-binding protein